MIIQRLVKKNFYYPTGYRHAAPKEEKGDGGINWEVGLDIYIYIFIHTYMYICIYTLLTLCIKYITNENLLFSIGNSTFCGDLNGKEIQKRGDVCKHRADSLCCRGEANTTL